MTLKLGSISAVLGIDTSSYTRGILNAQSLTQSFGPMISGFLANPILGAVSAMSAFGRVAVQEVGRAMDQVERLDNLSEFTGISPETIKTLETMASLTGKNVSAIGAALEYFTRQLGEARAGNDAALASFQKLNIDPSNIAPEDAFRTAIDAIAATSNAFDRAERGAAAFGRGGASEMTRLVKGGTVELDAMGRKLQELGVIHSRAAQQGLRELDDDLDDLKLRVEGLKSSLTGAFGEGVAGVPEAHRNVTELTNAVRTLGEAWGFVSDTIKTINEDLSKQKVVDPKIHGNPNQLPIDDWLGRQIYNLRTLFTGELSTSDIYGPGQITIRGPRTRARR